MNKKQDTSLKRTNGRDATKEFEKALAQKDTRKYLLRLFVTGMSPRSIQAIDNVRALCDEYLKGRYQLEIIDLYKDPAVAKENQIFASPTLIKKLPLPIRKFVGDMTKTKKVLAGLDIQILEQ